MTERRLLATVVSYCSNERPFVKAVLQNALLFSDVVVLSVGTRLYNGCREDDAGIATLAHLFPDVIVTRYDVPDSLLPHPIALHNNARIAGLAAARTTIETMSPKTVKNAGFWALLLDGDEVPDGPAFTAWWHSSPALARDIPVKLANYWYFLDARLVSTTHEDSVLLVHSSLLTDVAMEHPRERDGIVLCSGQQAMRNTMGMDGVTPMFHHYSWVRKDRAALLLKVANWGHSGDRPWHAMLEHQMDEVDAGRWPDRDFVHGYTLHRLDRAAFHLSF
jgi:hypothetical protein